jgi:hypothetical protein
MDMRKSSRTSQPRNSAAKRLFARGLTLLFTLEGSACLAEGGPDDPANYRWQAGAISHAQRMRGYHDPDEGHQQTPAVIPKFSVDSDPSGVIATTQPNGPTPTAQNAFFGNLGTNNRTCFTCHQPANGWGISAASVRERFGRSRGADPIFRLVDGATCPSDNVSTPDLKRNAYSLLINKGLIRIGLPVPANAQYRIVSVNDPYGCNTNPLTGLTTTGRYNPTAGIVSVYRRPLPSTNLGFINAIMWDGREPSLEQQSIDATLRRLDCAAVSFLPGHQRSDRTESTKHPVHVQNFQSVRELEGAPQTWGRDQG